ncbi:MAG: pyridoxamine 5-phosphate oxidase [Bacteroidota bacterium]|jgi:pyridoxamine 5'-phosphate oxidase
MSNWLKAYRESHADFAKDGTIDFIGSDPFAAFSRWFEQAAAAKEVEANAFVLSTVQHDLQPSSRIVYLKEMRQEAFVFYTNYHSHKGQDIAENAKVSMLFFWPGLMRQIRIEGVATQVPRSESEAYFASRPRESQLGAWASAQSAAMSSRQQLISALEQYDAQFPSEVPCPPHWGGYQLAPSAFEFWQGQASRLHERKCFVLENGSWTALFKQP